MSVLVTGASGKLGRRVLEALLARGVAPADIIAGARSPEKLAGMAERGISVVRLDYDDPASVETAVDGVQRVLLISGSFPGGRVAQHSVVVEAAKRAGVAQLAYTSILRADVSLHPLVPEHRRTEAAIAASGIPATVLRNGWYTENYLPGLERARATGEVAASVGDGRVASASRADYAEAAAVVLTEDGHVGKVYELTGDAAWNFDELAAAFTELIGREVVYRRLTPEEQRTELIAAGASERAADFALAMDAGIRDGWLGDVTDDLSRLIGRPTTPLLQGLLAAI